VSNISQNGAKKAPQGGDIAMLTRRQVLKTGAAAGAAKITTTFAGKLTDVYKLGVAQFGEKNKMIKLLHSFALAAMLAPAPLREPGAPVFDPYLRASARAAHCLGY
jgi:hypothetical protein